MNQSLELRGHGAGVMGLAFSPDGQRLLTGGGDGLAKIWDLTRDPLQASVRKLAAIAGNTEAVGFNERGQVLVAVDDKVVTFDPDRDTIVESRHVGVTRTWMSPAQPVCFDPDNRWVAGVSREDRQVARCADIRTGREKIVLRGHTSNILHTTMSRAAKRIATGTTPRIVAGKMGEVKVWDGESGKVLFELAEMEMGVTRLALSSDGEKLAIASIRDAADGTGSEPSFTWIVRVYSLAGSLEVSSPELGQAAVKGGHLLRQFTGRDEHISGLAFNRDGERLAGVGNSGTVWIWSLREGPTVMSHQGVEKAMDVAFSPDERRLAVIGRPMIKLLDAATGEDLLVLRTEMQKGWVTVGANTRICFSPDGTRIAAICGGDLSVWSGGGFAGDAGSSPHNRRPARHHSLSQSRCDHAVNGREIRAATCPSHFVRVVVGLINRPQFVLFPHCPRPF